MIYNYEARTKEGEIQSGRVEAGNEAAATTILQRHGLIVTALEETSGQPIYAMRLKFLERVGRKDLAIFSRQLSILFSADVPLVNALSTIGQQSKNTLLQETLAEIAADVDSGTSFSEALGRHADVFSNFYIEMVKGGEAAGKLGEVLASLAEHTEREHHTVSKIRGAMAYPAFVITAFTVIGVAILVFIIPRLIGVLLQGGGELPIMTRIMITSSNLMRSYWYLIFSGVFGGLFGTWWLIFKTQEGRALWDTYQLKIPIVGKLLRNIYIFRFAESLSMLTRGGVPIGESLNITARIIGSRVYRNIVLEARQKVIRGDRIAATLGAYPEIPGMVTQMVAVGEQTGKMDVILDDVAKFYQEEIDSSISTLTSLIEPIMIVMLGIGVGLLVAGVLLPIYSSIGNIGE